MNIVLLVLGGIGVGLALAALVERMMVNGLVLMFASVSAIVVSLLGKS